MDILDFILILLICFCIVDCSNQKMTQEQMKQQALKNGQAHLEQDSDGNVKIVINSPTTAPSSIEKK